MSQILHSSFLPLIENLGFALLILSTDFLESFFVAFVYDGLSHDQVFAYIVLSASSATTQVAWFSQQGNDGLGWLMVCNLYGKFCKQIGAGLVASFLAFLALLFTSGISLFNLFANPEE